VIRLEKVRNGHGIKHKFMLTLAPLVFGMKPPDILRVFFYRPEFFGRPFGHLEQDLLRHESEWSVGERELFAAYTSVKNRCRFCLEAHGAVASHALGHAAVKAIMDGVSTDAISPKAQAVLPFLEKLTLRPDDVSKDDIDRLRAAGLSEEAILDAAYVAALFCMTNRVVDALGCDPLSPKQLAKSAKMLLDQGYGGGR